MVNVEFRRKRLKRFPAKTTTDIPKVTLDTGYEPKDRVAKYEGERENPRQRIENSSFGSFELNTSHLNTTITNLTWKEACKQGGIDVQKIAKATREKVVIAQWNVSSWQPSIDQLMKEDFKPKSKISKDLVPLQNALAEISKNIRRAVETLGAWERLDQRSFEIIHPALNKLNDAKNMLIAKTRIHNEHVKTSGSRASRRARVFERWVWCVAAAFQEAGGKVTMTVKEAQTDGDKARYSSGFYLFALRLIRDESEEINAQNASAFGADLYRALTSLRKCRKGKNEQDFVIIKKSRVLRIPT